MKSASTCASRDPPDQLAFRSSLSLTAFCQARSRASTHPATLDRNRFDEFAEETLLETEGLRRVHVRGQEEIRKRILIQAAAFNLRFVMRNGAGSAPRRGFQGLASARTSRGMSAPPPVEPGTF